MTDLQWTLHGVVERLRADVPVIASGLFPTTVDDGDPRWPWAQRALDHVGMVCGGDAERLAAAVDAFAVTSFDFLRLQARFTKTGRYACGSASDLAGLYSDPEQMVEYLDGLALSYALWTNHVDMVRFYAEQYLAALPAAPLVVEIGPGHGLFATLLLERRPNARYVGVDISESSLRYTEAALRAAGADMDRVRLVPADATRSDFGEVIGLSGDDSPDGVVCCEVLEHVDDPGTILSHLAAVAGPGTPMFLSTVANLEAVDHVYLFDDVDHIRATLVASGITPDTEQPLVLPGSEGADPLPVNYSAIAHA